MEKSMFFYERKEPIKPTAETLANAPLEYAYFTDSFNLNKVVRSVVVETGETLVLLDDIHQRLQEVPVRNKQGKVTAVKNVMNTFQSEIYLQEVDAIRFRKLTSVD